MEAIFNPDGITVSWLNRDYLHDMNGRAFAFIRNGAVYLYTARQIGWFKNGYFRDAYGDAVAFIRGCKGGPMPPLPYLPPLPPLPSLPPLPPLPPLPFLQPLPTFNWSSLSWEQFVGWE
jgi:hypothetical protein